jgi:hypothetical protein
VILQQHSPHQALLFLQSYSPHIQETPIVGGFLWAADFWNTANHAASCIRSLDPL